jgi:predicted RecA/RadA family phage recombinase
MSSFKHPGSNLRLVAPYARASSGLGAKVGAIFGVSTDVVAEAAEGIFETEGVHELAKTSAQAWAVGDRIYWDDTNKRCDTDSTVGMFIGVATEIAANPTAVGMVKLQGPSVLLEGAQAHIADEATANGSDAATTQALANALKAKLNVLLAQLRLAGILKTS